MTLSSRLFAGAFLLASLAGLNVGNPTASKQFSQCSQDQYRPRYHFSPHTSWANDPNGLVYYDGLYHLFYQYHPKSKVWGPMHWGHATSTNLVTWKEIDIALEPDENGDIFSGSAVVDTLNTTGFKRDGSNADPIVAIYTSAKGERHEIQQQSLAYSLDKGMTFQKFDKNPVLKSENEDFRDPKVFAHNGKWIMSLAVGSKIEFYSSNDLKTWTKESEFGSGQGNHEGVWECPDLIPLNIDIDDKLTIEQWILLVSINPGGPNGGSATQYFVGSFTGNNSKTLEFKGNQWNKAQWLDWGPDNYAGVTFSNDPNGRFIYIGWMSNWLYANATPTSLWRGQMTIPRELSLRVLNHQQKQYRLVSTPVKEMENLRNNLQRIEQTRELNLAPKYSVFLTENADFVTPLMELDITLEIENDPHFSICASNAEDEEVCFGLEKAEWFLDRSKSGNTGFHQEYAKILRATGIREFTDKVISIRIFLDVSSIEVFADGGVTTMTALHYPSKPLDKLRIVNLSPNSSIKIKNYNIWGLNCWFSEKEVDSSAGVSLTSTIAIWLTTFMIVYRLL